MIFGFVSEFPVQLPAMSDHPGPLLRFQQGGAGHLRQMHWRDSLVRHLRWFQWPEDWIHWPLPDGLNSEPHDFLSGESESCLEMEMDWKGETFLGKGFEKCTRKLTVKYFGNKGLMTKMFHGVAVLLFWSFVLVSSFSTGLGCILRCQKEQNLSTCSSRLWGGQRL